MDPNALLARILETAGGCGLEDEHALLSSISCLLEWLGKGGFPPDLRPLRFRVMEVEDLLDAIIEDEELSS